MATIQRASLPAHEVKFTPLDLKRTAADGAFAGYASLFDVADQGGDVVQPGAFAKSLAARGPAGVKMLFQHDPNQPIGTWTHIAEDARGLYVEGQLTLEVAKAREVLALMRAGAIDGLSIGFKTLRGRRDVRKGVRRLEAVDLWEISIVTFPMLPEARVSSVKSGPFTERLPTEREFERWLTQDAGLTRNEARALLRSGFKGLAARRDAGSGSGGQRRLVSAIERAARLMQVQSQMRV